MTHNDDLHRMGDDFAEILAMDRIVDALGRGEDVVDQGTDDPLFELLVRARNEAGASIPPAPLVEDLLDEAPADIADEGSGSVASTAVGTASTKSRRRWARGASAVAAGGASMTTLLIAGGVAAAIAVGGLGYAAYQHSQPATGHKITEAGPDRGTASEDSATQSSESLSGDGSRANTTVGSGKDQKPTPSAVVPTKNDKSKEVSSPANGRESEATTTDPRSDAEKFSDSINQALEDPRVTNLPGYTPPPAVAQKMRERDGKDHPAYGEFTEPKIPGLNAPMTGGASTTTKPTETTSTKTTNPAPAPGPLPMQPPRGSQ